MSKFYQNESAYQEALNEMRFSKEAKMRMTQSLLNAEQPVKRRAWRPARLMPVAAAVCAVLAVTAGAAHLVLNQNHVWFVEDQEAFFQGEEAAEGDLTEAPALGFYYGGGGYTSVSEDVKLWWNDDGYGTLVEEAAGTAEDGWTEMRRYERTTEEGQLYQEERYLGEKLSGFNSLWSGLAWDLSWLEERYAAVPDGQYCYTYGLGGQTEDFTAIGEYQGDGDTVFHLEYCWNSLFGSGDEYQLASSYDYTELYVTADGVTVAIEMATSDEGDPIFWTTLSSGHTRFSMFGTHMELEDLRELLDSLNLSALCEYVAE